MKYFIVDAFAKNIFEGNQAGVCVLEKSLDDVIMQNIAAENNLAETAFIKKAENGYDLRWFTPEVEMDLCGHATMASAFVVLNFLDKNAETVEFHTKSGLLKVTKNGDLYEMDFPSRKPVKTEVPDLVQEALNVNILEAHASRDLVLVLESEESVKNLKPNLGLLQNYGENFAVVVTAKGETYDFVSRFFAPGAGIPEDPVTGSSHSTLIPFWGERLNKNEMIARQLSKRGGTLYCKNLGERVSISGHAVLYLEGEINL